MLPCTVLHIRSCRSYAVCRRLVGVGVRDGCQLHQVLLDARLGQLVDQPPVSLEWAHTAASEESSNWTTMPCNAMDWLGAGAPALVADCAKIFKQSSQVRGGKLDDRRPPSSCSQDVYAVIDSL